MKNRTKLALGGIVAVTGVLVLSGCTKSFCSNVDTGRMLYAFDPGITRYEAGGTDTIVVDDGNGNTYTVNNVKITYATYVEGTNEFVFSEDDKLTYLNTINSTAIQAGIYHLDTKSIDYLKQFDSYVLEASLKQALIDNSTSFTYDLSVNADLEKFERDYNYYSYLKYVDSNENPIWERFDSIDAKVREAVEENKCPSTDFTLLYKQKMNNYVAQYRTCLTTKTDKYGTYGYKTTGVFIEGKSWGEAWKKGFFEGLLVYPIGWLVDQIAFGFNNAGVSLGGAALLSILFVTLIIRSIMMLATIKQSAGNAKMTELQPEITKIQNKYPNANTSQVEKQRMAEEMNRLYKKNKINPFTTIIVMLIQFPVFICVWGALSGSAVLSSGTILNLGLSMTIRDVLFNGANWAIPVAGGMPPAVTALFLFILMSGAQAVSMLLPQWMQKAKAKKASKLGKNPAANEQANRMKWFTYIMLAMIIFMGFSLASAMGIYWFIGALLSIAQTLIMQTIAAKKKKQ